LRSPALDSPCAHAQPGRLPLIFSRNALVPIRHLGGFAVVEVADDAAARYWAGRIAVAAGWPQEVHRFPHRALSANARPEALS
jgi:hypothetical protein